MRRLSLTLPLLLALTLAGCGSAQTTEETAQAPPDTGSNTQGQVIGEPQEETRTPATLDLKSARSEVQRRDSGQLSRRAPGANPQGDVPTLEEIEQYLKGYIYPGSTPIGNDLFSRTGQMVHAATRASTLPNQVRDHYVKQGAKVVYEAIGKGGGMEITLNYRDQAAGVSIAIAITQAGTTDTGCSVSYSAHGIPRASEDKPALPAPGDHQGTPSGDGSTEGIGNM